MEADQNDEEGWAGFPFALPVPGAHQPLSWGRRGCIGWLPAARGLLLLLPLKPPMCVRLLPCSCRTEPEAKVKRPKRQRDGPKPADGQHASSPRGKSSAPKGKKPLAQASFLQPVRGGMFAPLMQSRSKKRRRASEAQADAQRHDEANAQEADAGERAVTRPIQPRRPRKAQPSLCGAACPQVRRRHACGQHGPLRQARFGEQKVDQGHSSPATQGPPPPDPLSRNP